ncbi:MAG: FecR domain-containing protein [Acidobacteria bacterium]|nr:FecR domain-containing protein [Acidobacteriota bacterium]
MSARSQDFVSAKILSAQGAVRIVRLEPSQNVMTDVPVAAGTQLRAGDVIKTETGGLIVLGLSDGSQAVIASKTTVEIKDLSGSPRTIFNVLRGKTRIQIQKMGGRPNPYRVTTPTTVIAVRGTIFDVFVKGARTDVFVTEGEVGVAGLTVSEREVILTPGQFTFVEGNRPPAAPKRFRLNRNDEFFRPVSENGGNVRQGADDNRNGVDQDTRNGDKTRGGGRSGNGRKSN